jgi:hypothetical protein
MSAPTGHPDVWNVSIALVFIAVGVALAASLLFVRRRPDGDDRRRAADAAFRLNGEQAPERRSRYRRRDVVTSAMGFAHTRSVSLDGCDPSR